MRWQVLFIFEEQTMRVGMGYDVHRLVKGRKLVLGGETIVHPFGLLGHSDADVLTHAVCDAVLGAAGMGDIGHHFPDADPQFKEVSSIILLETVSGMLSEKGFSVTNIDATLIAEHPKISPYREKMQRNIADALEIDPALVNVKATTTEGLGYPGKGEGMAAMCIALLHEMG